MKTHNDMLEWQYRQLLGELQQVQLHAQDPTCPCRLGDIGEYCLPKHTLNVSTLAAETAAMDEVNYLILDELAQSATEVHRNMKGHVCKEGEDSDIVTWSREWRKKIEPIYYACGINKKAKMAEYSAATPAPLVIQSGLTGIVPKEFAAFKVQLRLQRSKAWDTKTVPVINMPQAAQPMFRLMRAADREWLMAICLDNRLKLVGLFEQAIGTRNEALVSPNELARVALATGASNLILAHNHPSGDPTPSDADRRTFDRLQSQLKTVEIQVADMFVVGQRTDYSIAENRELPAPAQAAEAELQQPVPVKISGECGGKICTFKVKASSVTQASTANVDQLGKLIKQVGDQAVKGKTAVTDKTFAMGTTGVTRYEFRFRIVDAKDLLVSHDPFNFTPNKNYPQELQPRLRERAATRLQVEQIAANLEPEALTTDYKSIDRGAPIVGPDMVVESGNGRVMAIILAAQAHPERYARYREAVRQAAPGYALSLAGFDQLAVPVLVRERLTKVARKQFVEEANASATIETSAVEKARTDAEKITPAMINSLDVLEGEAIEDALRSSRNKPFVTAFLARLSSNEQAKLVDSRGQLNQDGVRRAAMALFVATFPGDTGIRLAEKFFESTDVNVRNVFNGIARSLGALARVENLVRTGERASGLGIGDDLTQAISVFSAIKKTPGMTVAKYEAQTQMFEKELTPFQGKVLSSIDEYSRSARRIAMVLASYADQVVLSPPPNQVSLIPGDSPTKEELWGRATRGVGAATLEEVERLFSTMKDYSWLAKKLEVCNLDENSLNAALGWKPFREFVIWAVSTRKPVQLCAAGMVTGAYQITVRDLDIKGMAVATTKAKAVPNMKRVFSPYREVIYEMVLPDTERRELGWERQEALRAPARREAAIQAALLSPGEPVPGEVKEALSTAEVVA